MNEQIENALIESTSFGWVSNAGIVTVYIDLKRKTGVQSFGGLNLGCGINGSAYGMSLMLHFLELARVVKWEDLPGQYIRIRLDDNDKICAIGHILEDKWFNPEKDLAEVALKENEIQCREEPNPCP